MLARVRTSPAGCLQLDGAPVLAFTMPGAEPCLVAVADADGCTGGAVVVCAPPADDDAVTVATTGLDAVDRLGQLKQAEDASIDFYSFVRSSYYQMRRAELREALGLPSVVDSPALTDLDDPAPPRAPDASRSASTPASRPASAPAASRSASASR